MSFQQSVILLMLFVFYSTVMVLSVHGNCFLSFFITWFCSFLLSIDTMNSINYFNCQIISMMSEHNVQNFSQQMEGVPPVVLGDEGLPRLYEDSKISENQLPRQHGNPWDYCNHFCPLSFLFFPNILMYFFPVFKNL